MSDESLMMCVQAGDMPSLQELMVRHGRGLYNYLARYTGDPHLAEDLFQETFLRALERREAFDPERGFRAWLYSIAANLARDACRRREVRSRAGHAPGNGAGRRAKEAPADPGLEAERREQVELVRRALQDLPDDARTMVLLHFYQGLRYREVADALTVPVGTVKSRIHWAVARLARAWNERAATALSGGMVVSGKGE